MIRRALPLLAALAATQLSSCVAAAIAPLAATGALGTKAAKGKKKPSAAKPATTPEVTVGQGISATPPLLAPAPPAAEPVAPAEPAITQAAGNPAAPEASADDPYAAMASYVLTQAETGRTSKARTSALLDQRSLIQVPKMRACKDQRGAVLIDLDPGDKAFDLDDPPSPAPGLAAHLRQIRGTGTAVVWVAMLPESNAKRLGTLLKATGLDPLGIDRVMLLGPHETRKQEILDRADEDWCVLAIAGDRKADFDEVFDYLRNPDGPVAIALEQFIGAGWFLAPPPIK
ncbi:hypothetical protein [Novosphingobium taihuense]|uniref:Uncharacterized protein n=1 Tax=Novosphingobium taihuense TaxID=260085 RepID=A0A7W7AEM2_9SPHN|nr:hypothetical protein [Novosphingobium taihuense]MBB4615625.1 hypothetical protein [Novosphingobium taihuense]TWH79558.1 hypothetical protein IQ25_03941 [Novosphingobium taihuense]